MATPGIKNVVVTKQSLPAVNSENQYILRYRIITDDRNRYSQWSPMYLVDGVSVTQIDADAAVLGRVISLVWDDPEQRSAYDVFVKFDSATDYIYHGTATATNYSLISQGTTSFQFLIQVEGMVKEVNNNTKIYESAVISLV